MLHGRVDEQRREDKELSSGTVDIRIEGNMIGRLPSRIVKTAVTSPQSIGHPIDAEPSECRVHTNRWQLGRYRYLSIIDLADLCRIEWLRRWPAPDLVPAIARAPCILSQCPNIIVARGRSGDD